MSKSLMTMLAVLVAACAFSGEVPKPFCEVWNVPDAALSLLTVPDFVRGDGKLRVFCDGEELSCNEIVGVGKCVVKFSDAARARSKKATLKIAMNRTGEALAEPKRADSVVVGTDAFMMTFDARKNGGLPSRLIWASGKVCDKIGWGDRVYAAGNDQGLAGAWFLQNLAQGTVLDYGRNAFFRHIRTVGEFAQKGGKTCDAHPRAVYDWIFPNDASEWVYLHMSYCEDEAGIWNQVHSGVMEVPLETFDAFNADGQDGALVRSGKSVRNSSSRWNAVLSGGDFAAVYSAENCNYADTGRKIVYLHASALQSYANSWSGDSLVRSGFYRFGCTDDAAKHLASTPPLAEISNMRRLDLSEKLQRVEADECVHAVKAGNITVNVSVFGGTRADVKSVIAGGRVFAGGGRLFTLVTEEIATGKKRTLTSADEWTKVEALEGGTAFRFVAPKGHDKLAGLEVVVRCKESADGKGCDWTFEGTSGTAGFALSEVTVGAVDVFSTGPSMRALYPGAMGHVKENPSAASTAHRGSYPSLSCVMPWEAVWDESTGKVFYVAAHDPKGGAKYVILKGNPEESSIHLALAHRLSWKPDAPQAKSVMSGTIAWRSLDGDWYDAALVYRDWARENAVWYPAMGAEGRRSTPDWFKNLGFIVRTWGYATNAIADVKACQDFFGVPVMAHWYQWHMIPFDNDYPHYFPAKPGFEEGVKTIHAMGAKAVPYTNGHIWDRHDRGVEDWQFSKIGAAGACMKRDGSLYEERYRSVETNGARVLFAPMCPASQVWHDKVGENCHKVVNEAGLDGYYMDQVGAFSTIDCRNPAHGHPFGGGSWWQEGYRKLLADARARCEKPVFFATEGNAEHTFDQIDAFVCWNIEGGVDTVPAFEVCYSGAVSIYCRSYPAPVEKNVREMRMKIANVLADGEMFGWWPASFCKWEGVKDYLRKCVRFRHATAQWFYKGEMRRAPKLVESVPECEAVWDIFGRKRATRMPVIQTGARRMLNYEYDSAGKRLWKTGRVKGAFVYFTNFSDSETVTSRVVIDWKDLGIDPAHAKFARVDAEGNRTGLTRDDFDKPFTFEPGACFGIEVTRYGQNVTHLYEQ